LAVVRVADPNPTRNRLRQPELWEEKSQFLQAIEGLRPDELTPELALSVASLTAVQDPESTVAALPVLTQVWRRFPQDFWFNVEIGQAYAHARRLDEAIGYFQVALSMRPDAALPHHLLSLIYYERGQFNEAAEQSGESLRIHPDSPAEQTNFGLFMSLTGHV